MSNPASQPRRLLSVFVVLLSLVLLVVLLTTGHLVPAVIVGLVALALLFLVARPSGT